MPYLIREVDAAGSKFVADTIHRLNRMVPETFPELTVGHLENGYWWLAYSVDNAARGDEVLTPIAFAGMVPNEPYDVLGVGYLKRAFVLPDYRGHGLQLRMMEVRAAKARQLGWTMLVSECSASNTSSARNFARAGYERCDPEQKWGAPNSIYFVKRLN